VEQHNGGAGSLIGIRKTNSVDLCVHRFLRLTWQRIAGTNIDIKSRQAFHDKLRCRLQALYNPLSFNGEARHGKTAFRTLSVPHTGLNG
jgi:hypothetical protein